MTTLHVPAQRQGPTTASAPDRVVVDLGWRRIVRVTVARAALGLVGSMVIWSMLPMLAGMSPRVILSGSMEPRIHVGDVIVTREVPTATLTKGQVITVRDPDHHDRTRTHRLLRRAADGTIVTKGDANLQADSSHVTNADVLGLGVLRVPFVGRPAYWVAEHNWVALGLTGILLSWVGVSAFAATRREQDVADVVPPTSGPSTGGGTATGRRNRRVRQAAAVAAASAIVVGAAVAPAQAAFSRKSPSPTSTFSAAASFGATTYASIVAGDGPQFFWRLGESSGSAAADQANGRSGQLSGSWTWGQSGAINGNSALHVDGGYVDQPTSLSSGTAFSVETWFRTSRTSGGGLLSLFTATGVERSLYLGNDGKVRFGRSANALVTSNRALNDGQWHHVVYTNNGSSGAKLYVDGSLDASAPTGVTATASGSWRAGQAQWSGNWPGMPDQFFRGDLDEVAVYGSTLTATQVSEHYAATTG